MLDKYELSYEDYGFKKIFKKKELKMSAKVTGRKDTPAKKHKNIYTVQSELNFKKIGFSVEFGTYVTVRLLCVEVKFGLTRIEV